MGSAASAGAVPISAVRAAMKGGIAATYWLWSCNAPVQRRCGLDRTATASALPVSGRACITSRLDGKSGPEAGGAAREPLRLLCHRVAAL